MSEQADLLLQNFEQKPLREFTEKAYLDYSMYVILDRALPHIGDGMKPVQRRIVYAMSELGLKNTAKYKKSARTVGDVLGKFHPHGDSACYEAMVLMAQPFSYRYPMVDGQGNWGSSDDPKSFAAMRYTESRLAAYAEVFLSEVEQGTVDWIPNFDGTLDEPKVLPSKLPNILLNGGMGIAVGMATDIPPHNLNEVVTACVHLLENPQATVDDLCEYLLAPDYPTEAEIITPLADIRQMYAKGNGSVKMRAVYQREQGDIVITALPHQVSGAKLLEQIAMQMQSKKLPQLVDLRDESDHENPTRLVLVLRSNRVDVDEVMSHLFATTDLEKSYRINFNMIGLDGRPQVKDLRMILSEWLQFRENVTVRRLNHRLEKVLARCHTLDGLLIAFLNIDEVIHIIRTEEDPKAKLMARFKLSEKQADAILDLKLRHLARLEEEKIKGEQAELQAEGELLQKTLASNARLRTLIKKELTDAAKRFGDSRRSPIVKRTEAKMMSKVVQIPSDPITVVVSQKGWVRSGKGHEVDGAGLSYKTGDAFFQQVCGRTNQPVAFMDSTGRTYSAMGHSLPSARGQGEPLTGRFNLPSGAMILATMMADSNERYALASSQGYGFVTAFENMVSKNRSGKTLLKVPEGADVIEPLRLENAETSHVAILTQSGKLLVIAATELPDMDKGKGARLIHIDTKAFKASTDKLLAWQLVAGKQSIMIQSGRKKLCLKPRQWKAYLGERGEKGVLLPKGYHNPVKLWVE